MFGSLKQARTGLWNDISARKGNWCLNMIVTQRNDTSLKRGSASVTFRNESFGGGISPILNLRREEMRGVPIFEWRSSLNRLVSPFYVVVLLRYCWSLCARKGSITADNKVNALYSPGRFQIPEFCEKYHYCHTLLWPSIFNFSHRHI